MNRAAFLTERKGGIGGSDVGALLAPVLPQIKYGCRRRLWYDKSGVEPDFDEQASGPMELGNLLEPYFADKYRDATGREVYVVGRRQHPEFPELAVNVDRMIDAPDRDTPGVAEIKSFGRHAYFSMKKDGMPADYVLQIQHGMLVTGTRWGSFIAGSRELGGTPLYWDVERDDDITDAILEEGPKFWKTLCDEAQIPDRLEPDDDRCQSCPWRMQCQGAALMDIQGRGGDTETDESLMPLLAEYDKAKVVATEAETILEGVKSEFKARVGDRQAVRVAGRPVYFRVQDGRKGWDAKGLAEAYDKIRYSLIIAGQAEPEQIPAADHFMKVGVPYRTFRVY